MKTGFLGLSIFLAVSSCLFAGTLNVYTDKPVYEPGEPVIVTIEARQGIFPVTLQFGSTCIVDYIMDGVYDSGSGISCAAVITNVRLPNTWNKTHNFSRYNLAPGVHTVTAYMHSPWTDSFTSNTYTFTLGGHGDSLELISPNGGQIYPAGAVVDIRWTDDLPGTYDIEYSTDNGSIWHQISAGHFDTSYQWTTPSDIHSDRCRVRITAAGTSEYIISNDTFTIFQCDYPPEGDINNDCYINMYEFAHIADLWMSDICHEDPDECINADVDQSGDVNFYDVAYFVHFLWLKCSNPFDPQCEEIIW